MLYYNRNFYCAEIHDNELSYDGSLYNNVYEIPVIQLSSAEPEIMQKIFKEIKYETFNKGVANEEMIRPFLKQIIIRATRIWKTKHKINEPLRNKEVGFIRKLSQLVEVRFKNQPTVSNYAKLLFYNTQKYEQENNTV